EGFGTGGRVTRRPHLRRAVSRGRHRRPAPAARRIRSRPGRTARAGHSCRGRVVKIAFVVQRYGTEILGGSEYHCRLVAERVAERHQVEVLTTCARDYITWTNEYPEGSDRIRGVTVRRFANARARDLPSFNAYSDWIFHNKHTPQDEMEWLKQQGPWSPALIEYLERHHQTYDVIVFFTYLYATTVLGIKVAPAKSVLVPTAHDEPAIRLGLYQDVFASAAGIVWNTDVERAFVSSNFRLRA